MMEPRFWKKEDGAMMMELLLLQETAPTAGPETEMITMWKNLPPELLERVTEFLSLRAVCRFRCVSKGWLHMLSCAQRVSRVGSEAECLWVLGDMTDLKRRIPRHLEVRSYELELLEGHDNLKPVSASGGLMLFSRMNVADPDQRYNLPTSLLKCPTLFVCNPTMKKWEQLPSVRAAMESHGLRDGEGDGERSRRFRPDFFHVWFIAVDQSTISYRVWAMTVEWDHYYLYDSRTRLWTVVRVQDEIVDTFMMSTIMWYHDVCPECVNRLSFDNRLTFDKEDDWNNFYEDLPGCTYYVVAQHHRSLFFIGVEEDTRTCYVYKWDDVARNGRRDWQLLGESCLDWLEVKQPNGRIRVTAVGFNNYICIGLQWLLQNGKPLRVLLAYDLDADSWSPWSADSSQIQLSTLHLTLRDTIIQP